MALELRERLGLRSGVGEGVGLLVVAIRLEVSDRLLAGPVGAALAVLALDRFRGAVEVVGRVVGPEVGAVAEDRAVLHQPVVEEDLLAAADVLAGEERLALGVDHALGDRRVGAVGPVGEQAEDEEAEQEDDDRGLDPGLRDQELPPRGLSSAIATAIYHKGGDSGQAASAAESRRPSEASASGSRVRSMSGKSTRSSWRTCAASRFPSSFRPARSSSPAARRAIRSRIQT